MIRTFGAITGLTNQPQGLDIGLGGGSSLVSYQSGISGWPAVISSTQDIAISPVSTATSGTVAVCRITIYNNAAIAAFRMASIQLLNATTIRVTLGVNSDGSAIGSFFCWEVFEYSNVKSKQTGTTAITASPQTIAISSVNMNKSLPFASFTSSFTTSSDSGHSTAAYRLASNTGLQVLTIATTMTAYWQVIEFN